MSGESRDVSSADTTNVSRADTREGSEGSEVSEGSKGSEDSVSLNQMCFFPLGSVFVPKEYINN